MHRPKLRLADLRVESFATLPSAVEGGDRDPRPSDRATCDSCAGPGCRPTRESCASGGDVCCG